MLQISYIDGQRFGVVIAIETVKRNQSSSSRTSLSTFVIAMDNWVHNLRADSLFAQRCFFASSTYCLQMVSGETIKNYLDDDQLDGIALGSSSDSFGTSHLQANLAGSSQQFAVLTWAKTFI